LEVNPLDVFIQLTKFLAESEASAVLVNAEDLWLSPDPQNVPGTWKERPNWSRKAQYPLGHWGSLSDVSRIVKALQSVLKNL
jgi:4-alpha-glucanotransferase